VYVGESIAGWLPDSFGKENGMKLSRAVLPLVLAGALAFLSLGKASAQTIPLASFSQSVAGATPFSYSSNGNTGSTNATFVTSTTVNFTFLDTVGIVPASTTFTGVTFSISGVATSSPSPFAPTSSQLVDLVLSFVTPVAQNGVGAGTLLLSMTATAGPVSGGFYGNAPPGSTSISIIGADNSTGAFITYGTAVPGAGNLNGNPFGYPFVNARDYSISLTSLTAGLAIDGDLADYVSHSASISGVFGYQQAVPEPGAVAMLIGVGVGGSLFGLRLRRRKA
jgi:hypothetical protein